MNYGSFMRMYSKMPPKVALNLYVAMGGIFLPPEHLNEHNFFSWKDAAAIFGDFVGI